MPDKTAEIEIVGNPALDFKATWTFACNVWDLQVFEGWLWIGCGNSANNNPTGGTSIDTNAGPVPILVYEPGVGFSEMGVSGNTIRQEQTDRFRVLDFGSGDQLVTVGHDNVDSNILRWYRLESGSWAEHTNNPPTQVHALDILISAAGDVYVSGASGTGAIVARSINDGSSWTEGEAGAIGAGRGGHLFEFAGEVYLVSTVQTSSLGHPAALWEWQSGVDWTGVGGSTYRYNDLYPGKAMTPDVTPPSRINRSAVFDSKWVYIGTDFSGDFDWVPFGLYSLTAISTSGITGATARTLPNSAVPYDLLVDGATLYVLGVHTASSNTVVGVYSTTDLSTWTEEFTFIPADIGGVDTYDHTFARSFEVLDGVWYFGLGSHEVGSQPDNVGQILSYTPSPPVASGSIITQGF